MHAWLPFECIYGEIVLILFCIFIYVFFLCSHIYGALLANFQPDDPYRHAGVYCTKSKKTLNFQTLIFQTF